MGRDQPAATRWFRPRADISSIDVLASPISTFGAGAYAGDKAAAQAALIDAAAWEGYVTKPEEVMIPGCPRPVEKVKGA
jgi:hypothetical protein